MSTSGASDVKTSSDVNPAAESPALSPDLEKRLARLTPAQRELYLKRMRRKNLDADELARRSAEKARSARAAGSSTVSLAATPIPRRARLEARPAWPLSLDQERIYFIHHLNPDSPFYNIIGAGRFRGRLRLDALEWAYNEVVRRHETLRTRFELRDGAPVQIVEPRLHMSIPLIDLRRLDARHARNLADHHVSRCLGTAFQLDRLPLGMSLMLQLTDDEFIWPMVYHHIVIDWVSWSLFQREIVLLYEHFLQHGAALQEGTARQSPLDELPIQYADFALWQRRQLDSEQLTAQLEYWRHALRDAPDETTLPLDHARPPVQRGDGQRRFHDLPEAASERLRQLMRSHGVTPFMAFLTLLKVLVLRLTGQRRLIIGSPTTARNHPDLEPLIGYLLYQLPFYTELSADRGFEEALRRVRTATLGAFDHGDTPFSKLIDLVEPERDTRRTPLTQLVLLFLDPQGLNTQLATPALPGLETLPYEFDSESSKFDATFVVWDRPAYHLWIEYDSDLFDATTVDRFARQFGVLLDSATADPARPLRELALLGSAERHQLLIERNHVALPATPSLNGLLLPQRFEHWAAQQPDAIAVVEGRRHTSYAALASRSAEVAVRLKAAGVGSESRVALSLTPSIELLVGLLGIVRSGAAYVPVDPAYPQERRDYLVADSGVELVVDASWLRESTATDSQPGLDTDATEQSTAYVIYTSGSTGQPKGVVMSHGGIARLFDATAGWFAFGPKDVWTLFHSFAFDFSVWEIWGALALGGRLVILDHEQRRQPALLARALAEQAVTVLNQTPSAFRGLIPEIWQDGDDPTVESSLGHVIFGGEALNPEILRSCLRHTDVEFVNMYGITETAVHSTYRPLRSSDLQASTSLVGVPLPDLQIYILDRHTRPLPLGVPGELVVGGAGLARGYLNRPSLTAQRFIPDPFPNPISSPLRSMEEELLSVSSPLPRAGEGTGASPGVRGSSASPLPRAGEGTGASPGVRGSGVRGGRRLYRSGDLARTRVDGDLEYLGRIDRQVKVRGYRIELAEVEAALDEHPAVHRAVAEVRTGTDGEGGRLVAWLQPTSDEELDVSQLRDWLRQRLPEHQIPSLLLPLAEVPLTVHGKIDRRALERRDLPDVATSAVFRAPSTPTEKTLCAIFAQVLGVPRVGLDDGFFDLGGDSLSSIRVVALAKDEDLQVQLPDLLRHPTVGALATHIDHGTTAGQDDRLAALPVYEPTQPFAMVDDEDRERLPDGVEDAYPLARLQAGMLFHMALTEDEPPYHNVDSYRLRGPFDPTAFERAVAAVVAEQPALRTSFNLERYRQPLQLVHAEVDFDNAYQLVDLRATPRDEANAVVDAFLEHHRSRPLPLDQPPLVRFVVHWLDDTEDDAHLFELSVIENHAIFDGWSLHAVLDDIFRYAYGGAPAQPVEVSLQADSPAVPVTYRDFVVLERRAEAATVSRKFWHQYLEDASFLEMPRWPLPPRQPDELRVPNVTISLTSTAAEAQLAASRELGVPVKSVALAAHLAALALWTGRDDIVTGFTANGRPEVPGGEQVRGLFLNSLPLRLRQPCAGTWRDLILRARDTELELLPHRRYPFATLHRELNVGREAQRELYEVAFNFVHFHVVDALLDTRLEVLDTRIHDVDSSTLVCTTGRQPGSGLPYLQFAWDADLMARTQVRRLGALFQQIYEAMAQLDQPVASLVVLTPAERHQLVVEWNEVPAPRAALGASVHQRILSWVERTPDVIAAVQTGKHFDHVLSYRCLGRQSARLAARLLDGGLQPEDRVGLFLDRSLDVPISLLAVLRAGGAYLPMDAALPDERLAWLLEDSGARQIVTRAANASRLEEASRSLDVEILLLDNLSKDPSDRQPAVEPCAILSDRRQLAYVIHTSGSTGQPKGVCAHHEGLLALLAGYRAVPQRSNTRASWWTRLVFDVSVSEIFAPLTSGATLEIAPEDVRAEAPRFLDWMTARHVESAYIPPFHLAELERRAQSPAPNDARVDLPPLVHLEVGVEPIPADRLTHIAAGLEERCGVRGDGVRVGGVRVDVINGYGPTEVTDCSIAKFVRPWHYRHTSPLRGRAPIGRNFPGGRVHLVNRRGGLVLAGVPGEIHLGGIQVTRGYLDRPALTAAAFVPDPFFVPRLFGLQPTGSDARGGARLYRTGDLARRAPDGDIEFLGRADHQIKIRGYRVELGEIEAVILSAPDVDAAAVVATDAGASVGLRLLAYVVASVDLFDEKDESAWLDKLERHLRQILPAYMVPSNFVLLDVLPRTATGKVDRRALPTPDVIGVSKAEYVAPRSGLEEALTLMWGELLGVEKVGVEDDFFDLGGHSLVATQLVSRLRDVFDLDVPLQDVFEMRTIGDLAAAMSAADDPERTEKVARAWLRLRKLSPEQRAALLASRKGTA